MNPKILFVDDEVNVLEGLRRGLRIKHKQWDMVFITDSQEAMKRLEKEDFQVIITDMLMPEVSGLELLAKARDLYPDSYRMILSGEMSMELGPQAQEVAHVCIRKPCSPKQLIAEVERLLNVL